MTPRPQCDHCGTIGESSSKVYRPWFWIRHDDKYLDFCSADCVRGWLNGVASVESEK